MNNVSNIIDRCGGVNLIVEAIENRGGRISHDALRKWKSNGIPEKWWQTLISLDRKLTAKKLNETNEALRNVEAA